MGAVYPREFMYNYETLSHLSGWASDRIRQDVARKSLKLGDLRSATIWLAHNGLPEIRAEMAKALLPVALGCVRRSDENGLANIAGSYDILRQLYKRDDSARHARGNRVSKSKLKKAKR